MGPAAVGVGPGSVVVAGGVVAVVAGAVAMGVAAPASVTVKVVLAVASPSTQSTVTMYSPG
jgi:hypothetical protein